MKTCQYCSIEISRGKNCSQCSTRKDEAYKKNNNYGVVMQAFETAKAEGLTGESFQARVDELTEVGTAEQKAERIRKREEERQYQERQRQARIEREARNTYLRSHGYYWKHFDANDEEDAEWVLYAPDGHAVSVAQALAEIERGVEVVRAEYAARDTAAEAAAMAELVAQKTREAAEKAEYDAVYAQFEAAKASIKTDAVEVRAFDDSSFTIIFESRNPGRIVRLGFVNGVQCGTIWKSTDDDANSTTYYCVDPGWAGLTPVVRDAQDEFLKLVFIEW